MCLRVYPELELAMDNRLLLTYGWVRSSYAAMRNLDSHGLGVHVADTGRVGMSQFSRFKRGLSVYCSHYVDEQTFVRDIKRLCVEHKLDLIMPSHNETEVLAKHRSELGERLSRLLPHYEH